MTPAGRDKVTSLHDAVAEHVRPGDTLHLLVGHRERDAAERGRVAPGMRADLVVLDGEHPDLAARGGGAAADALVFSGSSDLVRDVMVGGRWMVQQKRHAAEEAAAARYREALKVLLA